MYNTHGAVTFSLLRTNGVREMLFFNVTSFLEGNPNFTYVLMLGQVDVSLARMLDGSTERGARVATHAYSRPLYASVVIYCTLLNFRSE